MYPTSSDYHLAGTIPLDTLQSFSISAWFYLPSTVSSGFGPLFGSHDNNGGNQNPGLILGIDKKETLSSGFYYFINTTGTTSRYYWVSNNSVDAVGLSYNTWHHVVLTHDATTGSNVYLDGTVDNNGLSDAGSITNASLGSFFLARDNFNNTFGGNLDDVRIYNKALSQDEVTTLKNEDF
jgi:hypothetical protein